MDGEGRLVDRRRFLTGALAASLAAECRLADGGYSWTFRRIGATPGADRG